MNDYEAIAIAEGFEGLPIHTTYEQFIEAWQHLIDTGLCWRLQGWFGRAAQAMIENDLCKEAK